MNEKATSKETEDLIAACVQMREAKRRFMEDAARDHDLPVEHADMFVELEDFFVYARTRLEMKKDNPEPIGAFEKLDRACTEMAGEIAVFMAAIGVNKSCGVPCDLVESVKMLRRAFAFLEESMPKVTMQ